MSLAELLFRPKVTRTASLSDDDPHAVQFGALRVYVDDIHDLAKHPANREKDKEC